MSNKAKEIVSGYKNLIKSSLGLSSEADEKIFESRIEVCASCENRDTVLNICGLCGCHLAAKVRSLERGGCPINLW
jgi:hypothetical protein